MKKGDLRKQEILDTAEQLFCRYGYEQTSIQDILDRLNTSKGSFYHHFTSKEALLEGICRNRAEQIHVAVISSADGHANAVRKLDILLSGMIPFRDEKLAFLLMLLPIFRLPEGRMVRLAYCDALSEKFSPDLNSLLQEGHRKGELICPETDISAALILSIVNRLWTEICSDIISAEDNNTEADLSELLRLADLYRLTIERMVSVPYGSLSLVDIPALGHLAEQIHNHRIY